MAVRKPLVNVAGRVSEIPAGDTLSTGGGGGASLATGTATIDFGAAPGTNVVSVAVAGQTTIASGSVASAFMMAEATSDHNAYEHQVVPIKLTCGPVTAGVGFTITAVTDWRLTGTFNVRWIWS